MQFPSSYLTAAAFTAMCATAWVLIVIEFRRTRPIEQQRSRQDAAAVRPQGEAAPGHRPAA
jgi:hypothetical protein